MATDRHTRVQLKLQADPRLAASVSAATDNIAQRLGFELGPRAALAAAVEQACSSTFQLLDSEGSEVSVAIEDFDNRIEVNIEYPGQPLPSIGLETFAGFGSQDAPTEQPVGLMLLTLVDRVLFETVEGRQRMTLVKYLPPPNSNGDS